jgi:hypothetical protein
MGFFSSLWKGVKSVFTGIMKIFSPILKPLGKILGTGWGKALMLALSVFTMGASLMAGYSAFTNTAGSFLTKFVAGGKAFIGSLLGKKPAEAGTAAAPPVAGGGAAGELAAAEGINPGALLGDVSQGGGAIQSGSGAFGPGPTGDVMQQAVMAGGPGGGQGAMLPPGGVAPPTVPPGMKPGVGVDIPPFSAGPQGMGTSAVGKQMGQIAAQPAAGQKFGFGTDTRGWLQKAAGKAWEFAKTETGREIIGGMMEGYYQGKRDDAYYAEQRRIDDMWRNPNDPGRRGIEEQRQRLSRFNAPQGMAGAGSVYASRIARQSISEYQPSVPFTRAPGG